MVLLITGMSLLFIAIGYLVTENNARYLLAGYNTMTEEERQKVDIHSFIPYFKKFHLFLGLSLLIGGLVINYFLNEIAGGIFISLYPMLAYLYLIWNTRKFTFNTNKQGYGIAIFILTGTLVFVVALFFMGSKEDKLLVGQNQIELEGSYGELIPATEIASIKLINQLPQITMRTNGFASGEIRKGYFRTKEGATVKLMLHSAAKPYILITKQSGDKIYYSAKNNSNEEIYQRVKKVLPNVAEGNNFK